MTPPRLSRKTPLKPDTDHDFPPEGEVRECRRCGSRWDTRYYDSPPPWPCTGLKQTPLSQVSDRREEKRRARGVRGPLQTFVNGKPCRITGDPGDPAHIRCVGAGYGDWIWDEESGRWRGNVAPLRHDLHREYDGQVGGGAKRQFELRYSVDLEHEGHRWGSLFAEEHGIDLESEEHPYEQVGWS